jgi:hypothetical protein
MFFRGHALQGAAPEPTWSACGSTRIIMSHYELLAQRKIEVTIHDSIR